jgi:metallophosphoesterase superfamily enzyme
MLIISDLHYRCDTPAWRKESDYAKQVLRPQLASLLDTGEPVIVAGDVFHRSADFAATYDLFTFLKERGAVLYAVRGQHDMTLHSKEFEETGFNLLVKAGLIKLHGSGTAPHRCVPCVRLGWGEVDSRTRCRHLSRTSR